MLTPSRSLAALAAAVALLALTACNTISVQSSPYVGVPSYPATNPANVQVRRVAPTQPYLRLGEITLEPQGKPTVAQIEAKLQAMAAKLGANAVVIVEDRTMVTGAVVMGPWWNRTASPTLGQIVVGVAIRYTQ